MSTPAPQKITTFLMFEGRAEEAMIVSARGRSGGRRQRRRG
jgi:hypothetical protein